MKAETAQLPIRAEVYGVERLEALARFLAQTYRLAPAAYPGQPLLLRLHENARALQAAQRRFFDDVQHKRPIPPEAEWLLDNFYLVQNHIQQIEQTLTPAYYSELPKLAEGEYAGVPRVYRLALELIAHTDSHFTAEAFTRFIHAYQAVTPLTMGELWGLPVMLRLGLIENLRRIMEHARLTYSIRADAQRWANRLLAMAQLPPTQLLIALAELAQTFTELNPTFVVHLLASVRDQTPGMATVTNWLEQWLVEHGTSSEAIIRAEHQRRAANRLSTGNVITSLRTLNSIDWNAFFENVSVVEAVLRDDPAGLYARMEFATRDHYRHVIERLSRRTRRPEIEVAQAALRLAMWPGLRDDPDPPMSRDERTAHVGYYLIDRGRKELEAVLNYRPPLLVRLSRAVRRAPTPFYLGAAVALTALLAYPLLLYAQASGLEGIGLLALAALLAVPVSTLALSVADHLVTLNLPPRILPKLDFQFGIPAEYRTIVVIPCLISSEAGIRRLCENLELRYLANRDDHLHFALLGDFADSSEAQRPEDEHLLTIASHAIEELNERYAASHEGRFYFFHRRRTWNAVERTWMGWERKRGKLIEFNRLLRGATATNYTTQIGDLARLPEMRYVITLDADTELPINSARRLVGALAHPLNRPSVNPKTRTVTAGYGIIQPRTAITAVAASETRFTRLFAHDVGLDPYSRPVSMVYPDLFDAGSYIGKAIYDVDTALAVLADRFPENLLLSHDLIEGAHMRAGTASDIQVLEDFPSGYDAFIQRQHRWIRGDWQISAWLFPVTPSGRNALPLIERWKIFDNLRQSLATPAVVLLLMLGWTVLPGSPVIWTLGALLLLLFPLLTRLILQSSLPPPGEPWRVFFHELQQDVVQEGTRALLLIAFLLFEALANLDAIVRVFVRGAILHHGLLEWTSAAKAKRRRAQSVAGYLAHMWAAPAVALGLLVVVLVVAPPALGVALPFLGLWSLSPLLAYFISQSEQEEKTALPENAHRELRVIARRIWGFFEAFAGAEDHWLPPDNYQHDPGGSVAHRTSPTNIGFLILATLTAYDFGFLSLDEWIERLERVLNTLENLERFRGHCLNWYNTLTLEPLLPKYVSTVDSGNLAACLIVLKQMCAELETRPILSPVARGGLGDTATVLLETLQKVRSLPSGGLVMDVERLINILDSGVTEPPPDWSTVLNQITPLVQSVDRQLQSLSGEEFKQAKFWSERLTASVAAYQMEHAQLLEWMSPEHTRAQRGMAETEAMLSRASANAAQRLTRVRALAEQAEALLEAMDFAFLFHPEREVFAIGYNFATQRLDNSFYDLLASEARLASLIAIALGQVPARHWFRLSRPFTWIGDRFAALSWGGTMFEYLLPSLFMQEYNLTLLEQTRRAAIQAQIEYGARRGLPWGVSESGFYAFDYQLNYQYQLFGVPDLGLKQGLGEQRVIAPYATFLALPFAPEAAWSNLRDLRQQGALDGFGFYEALDYTPTRRPRGQRAGIVRSFMAHHQGMSLAALDNYLNQSPLTRRFHADPRIAALELLLQERVPHHAPLVETYPETQPEARRYTEPPLAAAAATRRLTTPHTFTPRAQVLSNGTYQVILTNAGGGYSTCQLNSEQLAITRWRNDSTRDDWGTFIYLRDLASQQLWSATYQPTAREPEEYEVIYAEDQATFRRRDLGIQTQTEIVIPPHDNLEIRRLTLTNTSSRTRTLEVTSYAEVVLDSFQADLMHPAFSKLFVESEFLPEHHTLLFHRRARMADQPIPWAWHHIVPETDLDEPVTCETDRARFIGRGRTPRHPLGAIGQPLSGTTGAVLDPIMSLRCRVKLAPGQIARLTFITGAATSREAVLTLVDKYDHSTPITDAFDLAQSYAQIQLRHIGLTLEMAHLFQRLASRVIYPDAALRAPASVLIRNTQGQSGLWGHGLSGDYPIVLVRIDEAAELELVRDLLHAHEYWRLNNFAVDLVILNEHPTSYADGLHAQIRAIIDSSLSRPWLDRPGGIFLRRSDHLPEADQVLLQSMARVVLEGDLGSLAEQLRRSPREPELPPYEEKRARPFRQVPPPRPSASPTDELLFPNSLGGFTPDGREYVITLPPDQWTPAPWINVLANPSFGCLISESGLGYTWSENSQANRLTPWSNDPISDPPGEVLYLRDDDTGDIWTPTPLPIRLPEANYVIRHGAGYSRFESTLYGLAHDLLVFVPTTDRVKIARLRVRNPSAEQTRHLALTSYVEWVLGLARSPNQFFIVTEYDASTRALFAHNRYNPDFGDRIAFTAFLAPALAPYLVPDEASPGGKRRERRALRSFTADRSEFLGRNGSPAQPAALHRGRLSERVGAGLDPCAAQQIRLELKPGEEKEVVFLLGEAESREQAREIIRRYSQPEAVPPALETLTAFWEEALGAIQVQTPEPGMDLLLNRWLLYQALACRFWARSAFYQSGGAYGFRDQLQDVLAFTHTRPDLTREHILRAAAHQFVEGDVQHWWHPHGPGVRTRFSDDYLWLPFAVHHYVSATGDTALLDEKLPYLKAPTLEPEQLESFLPHAVPGPSGSLYEHCCRALDHGLKFGEHGLPLMGSGDWNDAMNRVGPEGRGESVWLGWFLYTNLKAFAKIAKERGEAEQAKRYQTQAKQLQQAIEANAWDGAWYRRAYFDDGTPLGSAQNSEGQIDLIAQAWAVLSGAAGASHLHLQQAQAQVQVSSPARQRPSSGGAVAHHDGAPGAAGADRIRSALASVEQHLVREPDRLILLLTPPFDTAQPDPGYIRGYLPGIRENGGQYTHAGLWLAWAYADLGEGDRAAALFNLLSPIYHTRSDEDVARYKVEPYVVAADVYAQPQHLGRGGWTWYTGSASWMYRLGVEAILGLQRAGDTLRVNPCIPRTWPGFQVSYRFGQTRYEIRVENPQGTNRGVAHVELDNVPQPSKSIPLRDDRATHQVRVVLGD